MGDAVAGTIAIVERGTCPFYIKALMAADKGAVGVIIVNSESGTSLGAMGCPSSGQDGYTERYSLTIPVFFMHHDINGRNGRQEVLDLMAAHTPSVGTKNRLALTRRAEMAMT